MQYVQLQDNGSSKHLLYISKDAEHNALWFPSTPSCQDSNEFTSNYQFLWQKTHLNYDFCQQKKLLIKRGKNKQTLLHRPRPSCLACSSNRNNSARYGLASPFCCPCSLTCIAQKSNQQRNSSPG